MTIKQQIWHLTGRNLYWIVIAKARIRVDGDYEKLLAEVERMKEKRLSLNK